MQDETSIISRRTYRVSISVDVMSEALLTEVVLLDIGVGMNLYQEDALHCVWKESVKRIRSPLLQVSTNEAVDLERIVLLLVCRADLRGTTCLWLLEISPWIYMFRDAGHGRMHTETIFSQNVISRYSRPVDEYYSTLNPSGDEVPNK